MARDCTSAIQGDALMRPRLLLLLSVLLGITAPALGADRSSQVCRSIATMLQAGSGNKPEQGRRQTLLETLAHNSRGRLSLADWQRQGDRRAGYLRDVGMQAETGLPMTAALKAEQLVAVMTTEGSASCMDVSLFQSIGHRLVRIVPPYVTRITSCQRWGDSISLGSLDGRPFVAKETTDDTDIQVAPWNGRGWDPVCGVAVKYAPELISEGAFCHAANCAEAEAEAKHIALQIRPEGVQDYPYQAGIDPQLDHLVELAGRTPGTDAIPSSPGWLGPDFMPRNLVPYMTTVDGHPTLAIAGEWKGGPAIDSQPIGYAVALWQEAGDRLTSVAGFHLRTSRSTIKSASVTR
jgi:hypothetical protein